MSFDLERRALFKKKTNEGSPANPAYKRSEELEMISKAHNLYVFQKNLMPIIFSYSQGLALGGPRADFHYFEADPDSETFRIAGVLDKKTTNKIEFEFAHGGHPSGKSFGVNSDFSIKRDHVKYNNESAGGESTYYLFVDKEGGHAKFDGNRELWLMDNGDITTANSILYSIDTRIRVALGKRKQ